MSFVVEIVMRGLAGHYYLEQGGLGTTMMFGSAHRFNTRDDATTCGNAIVFLGGYNLESFKIHETEY